MNQSNNVAKRSGLIGSALALAMTATPAIAGEAPIAPVATNNVSQTADFCSWLSSKPGTLYKSSTNPYIQEVGIFGRFHYQEQWVDGDANGQDFSYHNAGEIRRFRLGARVKFLNYFHLWANADLENDTHPKGGSRDIEYSNIYEAQLLFDAKKAFGMDGHSAFEIGVGKQKIGISEEALTSSKKIKTIERSAIANKLFPTVNPMGMWVDAKLGKVSYFAGVYNTEASDELSDMDRGMLYLGRVGYDFTSNTSFDSANFTLTYAHSDNDGADDDLAGFDWAAGAAVTIEQGRAGLLANVLVGENRDDQGANRDGSFVGVVVMPTYWIVADKLEGVFRYQYQHADSTEGIRLNSRYARNAGDARREDIASLRNGRGDNHHSIYAGLNYYLCGDNSKIMAGVEWDELKKDGSNVYDGFTYGAAYRMYF